MFSFNGKKLFDAKMKWDAENNQIAFDFDVGPQSLQVKCPKTGQQVIDQGGVVRILWVAWDKMLEEIPR